MNQHPQPDPHAPGWSSRTIHAADLGAVMDAFGVHDTYWLQLSPPRGSHELTIGQIAGIRFTRVRAASIFQMQGATPADALTLQLDLGSAGRRAVSGRALGPSDLLVAPGGTELGFRTAKGHHGMNFRIPSALAAVALAERAPAMPDPLRAPRLGVAALSGSRAERMRCLAAIVLDPASTGADVRHAALAGADLADAMLGALLAPWHRDSAAGWRELRRHRLPVVRRAEAFMRAHLGEPLMLHDICRAARACERTVEYGFREVHGMGAKQYLKLLRLAQVRGALRRAEADEVTVREASQRAGFWHMGHFSAAYRRQFGETPSETLGMPVGCDVLQPARAAQPVPVAAD